MSESIKVIVSLFLGAILFVSVIFAGSFFAAKEQLEIDKQYSIRFMACVHAGKPPSECKLAAQR